ncbi:MAG: hypothetical protein ACREIB_10850 [Pseudomonadota bacterium]
MKPAHRMLAALLLAMLLPIQGFAAACAQICAMVQADRHIAAMALAAQGVSEGESADGSHCGDSEMGAGKCCQAHAFMIDVQVPVIKAVEPFHERAFFIARWTNFIPEEPSPPPIPAASIA